MTCNICMEPDRDAAPAPHLIPFIEKHLGIPITEVISCEPCGQLLSLWDEFSDQARANLAVSAPTASKPQEEGENSTYATATMSYGTLSALAKEPNELTEDSGNQFQQTDTSHLFVSPDDAGSSSLGQGTHDEIQVSEISSEAKDGPRILDVVTLDESLHGTLKSEYKFQEDMEWKPEIVSVTGDASVFAEEQQESPTSKDIKEEQGDTVNEEYEDSQEKCKRVLRQRLSAYKGKKPRSVAFVSMPSSNIRCPRCPQSFISQLFLFEHLMIECLVEKTNKFFCPYCNKILNKKSALRYHLRQHFSELAHFACHRCDHVCTSYGNLRQHVLVKHNEIVGTDGTKRFMFRCDSCNSSFYSSAGLFKHRKECASDGRPTLAVKAMPQEENESSTSTVARAPTIKNHIATKVRPKTTLGSERTDTKCEICNIKFSNMSCYRGHKMRFHSNLQGSGRFLCKICHRKFISMSGLLIHIRFHKGYGLLPSVNRSGAQSPKALQDDEDDDGPPKLEREGPNPSQPLVCTYCSKKMSHAIELKNHVLRFHVRKNVYGSFKCNVCHQRFFTQVLLSAHFKKAHPSTHRTPIQRETSSNVLQATSVKCHICNLTYSRKYFPVHLRLHKKDKALAAENKNELNVSKSLKEFSSSSRFPCDFCHIVLDSEDERTAHLQALHSFKKVQSQPAVPKPIPKPALDTSQPSTSESGRPRRLMFKCQYCKKVYGKKRSLVNHIPRCPVKNNRATTKDQTSSSRPSTSQESKPDKIDANKASTSSSNCPEPPPEVLRAKYVSCKFCGKKVTKPKLHTHILTMHAPSSKDDTSLLFKCKICSARTRTIQGLKIHMSQHKKYPANKLA